MFNSGIELVVIAFSHPSGEVFYNDVRLNPLVFHDPFTLQAVNGELRHRIITAVNKWPVAAYANNTSPRAFAHQRA